MVKINSNIFCAYDIRGIYPEEVNKDIAYLIGKAYISFLNSKFKILNSKLTILVSRDMRIGSQELSNALIHGLLDADAKVIDMGLSTSPMHYFGINFLNTDGGIMVTASHNPAQFNGFKISLAKAAPVGKDSGLEEIRDLINQNQESGIKNQESRYKALSILDDYVNFLTRNAKINKNLKLVVDAGNGMAGIVLPKVFEKLRLSPLRGDNISATAEMLSPRNSGWYYPLYFEPDGRFPNHEANPSRVETLAELKKKVLEVKADLGIAFDGDADRVGFVTRQGEEVRGDYILALLAARYLEDSPGGKIIYDVRCSRSVLERIKEKGGVSIRSKVGHAYIKERLKKENGLLGGELSMHYYFKEFFNCDSGILAMIKVLELISASGKKLDELIKPLRKYYQSGEINFPAENTVNAIKKIEDYFKDGKIDYLDGLTIEYSDWWFNARPSGTESFLRLNIEANSRELLQEKEELLRKLICV